MAVDAAELVAAWAAAASRQGGARVASLVAALAVPDGERGDLTMAAWDGALLDVLAAADPTARLDGIATCPSCGQRLDVVLTPPPPPGTGPAAAAPITVEVRGAGAARGMVVSARIPTLADLDAALATGVDLSSAVAGLVDRIVVEVADAGGMARHGAERAALLADEGVLAVLDAALAEAEPAAVDPVELDCPDCGHRWSAQVALDAFAWAATERAAGGLLDEVHRLAGAYGWTHDAVLALPAPVRRHYLERVG